MLEMVLAKCRHRLRHSNGHSVDIRAKNFDRCTSDGESAIIDDFANENASTHERHANFGDFCIHDDGTCGDKPFGRRRNHHCRFRDGTQYNNALCVRATVDGKWTQPIFDEDDIRLRNRSRIFGIAIRDGNGQTSANIDDERHFCRFGSLDGKTYFGQTDEFA